MYVIVFIGTFQDSFHHRGVTFARPKFGKVRVVTDGNNYCNFDLIGPKKDIVSTVVA